MSDSIIFFFNGLLGAEFLDIHLLIIYVFFFSHATILSLLFFTDILKINCQSCSLVAWCSQCHTMAEKMYEYLFLFFFFFFIDIDINRQLSAGVL